MASMSCVTMGGLFTLLSCIALKRHLCNLERAVHSVELHCTEKAPVHFRWSILSSRYTLFCFSDASPAPDSARLVFTLVCARIEPGTMPLAPRRYLERQKFREEREAERADQDVVAAGGESSAAEPYESEVRAGWLWVAAVTSGG